MGFGNTPGGLKLFPPFSERIPLKKKINPYNI